MHAALTHSHMHVNYVLHVHTLCRGLCVALQEHFYTHKRAAILILHWICLHSVVITIGSLTILLLDIYCSHLPIYDGAMHIATHTHPSLNTSKKRVGSLNLFICFYDFGFNSFVSKL